VSSVREIRNIYAGFAAATAITFALPAIGSAEEICSLEGKAPAITLVGVPPKGAGANTWGQIVGKTARINPDNHRVVLYACTDQCYVQPWANQPFTKLANDGSFQSGTHLGYTYAALLVDASFVPSSTLPVLPEVGGSIAAKCEKPGR
jgi:hypothetical protein